MAQMWTDSAAVMIRGHAGCVTGSAAVSGDASGVDVMHKEVNRDTEGKRQNTECQSSAHAQTVYVCAIVY